MKNLRKLLTIVIVWTVIGLVIAVYDHLTLISFISAGFGEDYDLIRSLVLNGGVGLVSGFLGGGYLVYVVNERFRDEPYWKSIALVIASFILVSGGVIFLVSYIQVFILPGGENGLNKLSFFLADSAHLKNIIVWLIVLVITQVTLQVNDKFGQKNWVNFLLGKYHQPKIETRIFMFVDLMSSTSIAETLGNEKYHLFLKDFFSDLTSPILTHLGELYQYVGDEVIISWKFKGNEKNDECLKCYFAMSKKINGLSEKYLEKYGIVPEFKAGVHFGEVVAGEIGVIKRELTFSGDVLNTTSRIQGKCNELRVRILVSDQLLSVLPIDSLYRRIPLGDFELRGVQSKVGISSLAIN